MTSHTLLISADEAWREHMLALLAASRISLGGYANLAALWQRGVSVPRHVILESSDPVAPIERMVRALRARFKGPLEVSIASRTSTGRLRPVWRASEEGADNLWIGEDEIARGIQEVTARIERERSSLGSMRAVMVGRYQADDLVIHSEASRAVYALAERAASSMTTMLITGASGTGKERLARFIHFQSDRAAGPFIPVNCKALSPGVLESELFGHAEGAFTGAARAHRGYFEQAQGGTIFLDEIGDASLDMQGKLLRVLQEREVQPLGAMQRVSVDARVLAATNRDLEAEVAAGTFREDLYFRLAVIPLHLPTLEQRKEEILPLARHFLEREAHKQGRGCSGWTHEVEVFLETHSWQGNVRELENIIERAVVLSTGELLELDDILIQGKMRAPTRAVSKRTLHDVIDDAAARRIREALANSGGKRLEAAEELGIDRSTLYRMMQKHGIAID